MTHTKKDNSKKKIGFIMVGLLLVITIMIGSLFAFFSDIITGTGTVTTGTLDLVAGITEYKKNDVLCTADKLLNFNPGDVIVVKVPITNTGSKSAWLRGNITLNGDAIYDLVGNDFTNFDTYFEVYKGEFTKAEVLNATASGARMTLVQNAATKEISWEESSPTAVINGNPAKPAPELESLVGSGGTVPAGNTVYDATGSGAPTISYTIYFKGATSLNEWQDKTINFNYKIESMQYRNSGEGGGTIDWTDLVTAPFGS